MGGDERWRTNLVLYHGITDVLNHPAELIHILGALQELYNLALLCQWHEVFEDVVEFAIEYFTLGGVETLKEVNIPFEGLPPFFLLDLTLGNRSA